MQSLEGKRVLITGASRGIGAETARRMAGGGARVALVGLEPEQLEQVAGQCGQQAVWAEADVTDWDGLGAAVESVVGSLGGLDAVVANAGIAGGGPVRLTDPWAFERVIEVNLLGVWRTVRVCLPHVLDSRGYLLLVASIAAVVPVPGNACYAMAKAGVHSLGRSLHVELAHRGVDVGVAYFTWLDSDLVRGADEHPAFARVRSQLRWPLNKTYPVGIGADAIVRGIERRSRVVVAPAWVRWLIAAPGGLLRRISER
jgi:NAD(P)-dependent dehydrogenase (short-subunit alcohol dehydrogenase family)